MAPVNISDYLPEVEVQGIHGLPHLNGFHTVSNDFNITYTTDDPLHNDYVYSLYPFPNYLGSLVFLCFLVFIVSVCSRNCNDTCKCFYKPTAGAPADVIDRPPMRAIKFFFVAFLVLICAFDANIIAGSYRMTDGVNLAGDSCDYLEATFTNLNNYGNRLNDDGVALLYDLNLVEEGNSTCDTSQLDELLNTEYFPPVNDFIDSVSDLPDKFSSASDDLNKYGIEIKDIVVWILYALSMSGAVLYTVAAFLKSPRLMKVLIGFTCFLMTCLIVVVTIELITLMAFADFCMDPVYNTIGFLQPDTLLYNATTYYLQCQGANPLTGYLWEAEQTVEYLNQAVNALLLAPSCQNNQSLAYLNSSLYVISDINSTYYSILSEIDCPPIHDQFLQLLEEAFCDRFFKGYWRVWSYTNYGIACTLALTIVVSVMYQFFGKTFPDTVTLSQLEKETVNAMAVRAAQSATTAATSPYLYPPPSAAASVSSNPPPQTLRPFTQATSTSSRIDYNSSTTNKSSSFRNLEFTVENPIADDPHRG